MLDENKLEQEIKDKGLVAPRLTPQLIDEAIKGEAYYIFPQTTTTVCLLTLRNGYTTIGESACASPENFDIEIGKKLAKENARNKIWSLEGYRGECLTMKNYIGTKLVNAKPMNRLEYNEFRGLNLPKNENGSDEGYLVEYCDGGKSNHPNFIGYISWSPKEQFDNAYIEFNGAGFYDFQQRVIAEKAQLDDKIQKLNAFFSTSIYDKISYSEQINLKRQHIAMLDYSSILKDRIAGFKVEYCPGSQAVS